MTKKNLLLLAAIFCCLNAFSQIPPYVPTNGLIGWWPFTGNANDSSGNGNNGIVNGATLTTDRFGSANSAYSYNGASTISVPDNFSLSIQPGGQISISAWAYKVGTNATGHIFGKRINCLNFQYQLGFDLSAAGIGFGGIIYNVQNSYLENIIYTFPEITWIHFVGTFDGQTWKLYQNGVLMGTLVAALPTVVPADLLFGGSGTCQKFIGKIDDIGMWNRALIPAEVTNLFNAGICYQTITVTDTLIINANITGFNPITFEHTIKIYPNPTNDHITIDYGNYITLSGYTLKIVNTLSQTVFTTLITQQQSYVDLSTWTGNGIYFVHLIDPQQNTVDIRKIILQ